MNGPRRIRIKICGMTRLADALCAVEAGVDALGFIFYAKSPRAVATAEAQAIIAQLPPLVSAVGVFVNETVEQVVRVAGECRLSALQLHGAESPDYCRNLAGQLPFCRLLKAIRVGPHTTPAEIAAYRDVVHGYLLDTFQQGVVGGTGQTFDWTLIDRLGLAKPFLLAGGLDPDNVDAALQQVLPYAVDANSGLEDAPGSKNHELIRRFIAAVRSFETSRLAG